MFQQWYCLVRDAVWLWGLYYGGLGLHPKSCKLCFDTYKWLFRFLVTGFHCVVDEVVIVGGFLQIVIDVVEVGIANFCDVVKLAADTTRQTVLNGRRRCCLCFALRQQGVEVALC